MEDTPRSKFAPVAPIHIYKELQVTSEEAFGDYFLLLAHDVVKHPKEYREVFYDKGYTIIMDNSVIELGTAVDIEMLTKACNIVGADVLAIPDVLQDGLATVEATFKFMDEWRCQVDGIYEYIPDLMFIPQGSSPADYEACITTAKTCGLKPEWIGIARNLTTRVYPSRDSAVAFCKETFPDAKIHLLGFSENTADDLLVALRDDVEGIDSAVPLRIDVPLQDPIQAIGPRGDWWENAKMSTQVIANLKDVRKRLREDETTQEEYFVYLDELRESGDTNMYGATPYLVQTYGIDKKEACDILAAWMKDTERHK